MLLFAQPAGLKDMHITALCVVRTLGANLLRTTRKARSLPWIRTEGAMETERKM